MLLRNLKSIQNVLVLLTLTIFLTSCSSVKELSIFKEEVERQPLNLPLPTPLEMEKIEWIILTSDNAEQVFKKMEEQGLDPVIFGLTDNDYQLISKNFARIRNHLKIQNDMIEKYKEYYESDIETEK